MQRLELLLAIFFRNVLRSLHGFLRFHGQFFVSQHRQCPFRSGLSRQKTTGPEQAGPLARRNSLLLTSRSSKPPP